MFSWNSAAHQQWVSTPQNNHAVYANPIDCLAQVAAFVLESQHAVLQHGASAPLDVASRAHQQRTKLHHQASRGAAGAAPATPAVPPPPPAPRGGLADDPSPQDSAATDESPADSAGGGEWNPVMDVSPVLDQPSPS